MKFLKLQLDKMPFRIQHCCWVSGSFYTVSNFSCLPELKCCCVRAQSLCLCLSTMSDSISKGTQSQQAAGWLQPCTLSHPSWPAVPMVWAALSTLRRPWIYGGNETSPALLAKCCSLSWAVIVGLDS